MSRKLPATSYQLNTKRYHLQPRKGFTIIEMIIVITIFTVAVASTLPLLTAYKNRQSLSSLTTDLLQVMRRAQGRSLSGTNGVPWGVVINRGDEPGETEDEFVMFANDLSETYLKYQEHHEVLRPYRLCTNKTDDTILFPQDINVESNETYFVEIYSEDEESDRAYILINTAGTIEQTQTHTDSCAPTE